MIRNSKVSNQTTCSVVAYDIPKNKRRTNVQKILLGHGKWTHYSLFECFLSRKEMILFQTKLEQHLVETEESVRFYPLCAACVSKGETVGGLPPAEDVLFVIEVRSACAGLSDQMPEQRPAHLSTGDLTVKEDRE